MPQQVSKKAVVIHSGGMDSSICLKLALEEFGKKNVTSLTFSYQQRHEVEVEKAVKICRDWGVDNLVVKIDYLSQLTKNALTDKNLDIKHQTGETPNTLVVGRNGLMARLGAIYADQVKANFVYMGVIEVEECNSGYRDCSRIYMDKKQNILRMDLDNPHFEIRTPLVKLTKKETLELAAKLGVLDYLLKETITCYESKPYWGCRICPACLLRNDGIQQYKEKNPSWALPY